MQQHLAAHRTACALQVFEDIGFLLGQPDALGAFKQDLGARTECVRTDLVDGFFARAMAAQMRIHTGDQDGEAEGLRYVIVRAGLEPGNRIGIRVGRGQNDDRAGDALLAQRPAQVAAIAVGERHVEHHELIETFESALLAFFEVARLDGFVKSPG
jgi:hypothetical protein